MNYQLTFDENEINIISRGIGKLPMEEAIGVFAKIKDQCGKQAAAFQANAAIIAEPPANALYQGVPLRPITQDPPSGDPAVWPPAPEAAGQGPFSQA